MEKYKMLFQLFGGQAVLNLLGVMGEAGFDTITDWTMDKLNEELMKLFPNTMDPNSLGGMFMQNVKMQTTVQAQARMMAFSMKAQQKSLETLDKYKEDLQKKKTEVQTGWKELPLNMITLGKRKEKQSQIIDSKMNNATSRLNTSINSQINASGQVGNFTIGCGTTKQAYDNANNTDQAVFNTLLFKLISAQGYYEPKKGQSA